MRLWLVTPCSKEFAGEFGEVLQSTVRTFARKETTVNLAWIAADEQPFPTPTMHVFAELTNAVAMANSIIRAQSEGFDAGILGCFFDPGLYAARAVVDIPVTGPCESSVLYAHTLGYRYSVLTLEDLIALWIEENISRYGLEKRLGSVRGMGVTSGEAFELYSKPDDLVTRFISSSKKMVSEDKCEVIIPGCTILSTILSAKKITEVEGIPILDGVGTSIKMAEMSVDLKAVGGYKVGRSGFFGREHNAPLHAPLNYSRGTY